MADLSVIIPARNEAYLPHTIRSVLDAAEADTEVIAVLDGYTPADPLPADPRLEIIHHALPHGQRASINEAARAASGRFLMKLDAHCAVGPGFDRILISDWQPGWTIVPRMYNLDIKTFMPKLHKRTDYMYIGWNERDELRALYYGGSQWKRWHSRPQMIDETMACMGPGWFLAKEDFWRTGGCDENHGSWGQQGVEVSLKAWLSGGALVVNKNTWFSHWFRAGDGGAPYKMTGQEIEHARQYSKDLWANDRWPGATRKLSWLVEKFDPPTWGRGEEKEGNKNTVNAASINIREAASQCDPLLVNAILYEHIHKRNHEPRYRGVRVIKMPTDLMLYHQAIWQARPDFIVETGTKFGGSALYFQDQLDLLEAGGRVVTIDIRPCVEYPDPRIIYITGSSTDEAVIEQARQITAGKKVMVVLDSSHERVHVKWELYHYGRLVTSGQYLVIEDCYGRYSKPYSPMQARDWFLGTRFGRDFERADVDGQFLAGVTIGGWLKRK